MVHHISLTTVQTENAINVIHVHDISSLSFISSSLFFSAEEIYGDYGQFRAVITTSGHIHWEPGGIFKTVCQIDITYYPFDEQRCDLMFGAWSYHTTKMNLSNVETIVNLDSYEENGEWEIYK